MRNHAPKAVAGYEAGVTKGSGSSFRGPRDFTTREPWTPPPDGEPKDDRERRARAAFYAHRSRLAGVFPAHPTWAQMTPIQQEAWADAADAARREP